MMEHVGLNCRLAAAFPPERRSMLAERLFLVGFCLYLAWKIIASSVLTPLLGSPLNTAAHGLSLAFVCLSCVLGFRRERALAVAWAALAAAVGVKIASGTFIYIDLVLLFYAGRNVSFKKIAKATLAVTVPLVVLIVTLSQVGIVGDYLWSRDDGTVRHGLGFLYCNKAGFYLFSCAMLWAYVRGERITVWEVAAILALDAAQYMLTDAKNPTLWVAVVALGTLALRRCAIAELAQRFFRLKSSSLIFVLLAVLALAVAIAYDSGNPVWQAANSALTNRLVNTHEALSDYGVSPFAPEIELVGNGLSTDGTIQYSDVANPEGDRHFIDNSYVNILVTVGAVPLALVLAMCTAAMARAARREDVLACFLFAVVALFSTIDAELTTLWFDGMLILMWQYAWEAASEWLDGLPWPPGRSQRDACPNSTAAEEGSAI